MLPVPKREDTALHQFGAVQSQVDQPYVGEVVAQLGQSFGQLADRGLEAESEFYAQEMLAERKLAVDQAVAGIKSSPSYANTPTAWADAARQAVSDIDSKLYEKYSDKIRYPGMREKAYTHMARSSDTLLADIQIQGVARANEMTGDLVAVQLGQAVEMEDFATARQIMAQGSDFLTPAQKAKAAGNIMIGESVSNFHREIATDPNLLNGLSAAAVSQKWGIPVEMAARTLHSASVQVAKTQEDLSENLYNQLLLAKYSKAPAPFDTGMINDLLAKGKITAAGAVKLHRAYSENFENGLNNQFADAKVRVSLAEAFRRGGVEAVKEELRKVSVANGVGTPTDLDNSRAALQAQMDVEDEYAWNMKFRFPETKRQVTEAILNIYKTNALPSDQKLAIDALTQEYVKDFPKENREGLATYIKDRAQELSNETNRERFINANNAIKALNPRGDDAEYQKSVEDIIVSNGLTGQDAVILREAAKNFRKDTLTGDRPAEAADYAKYNEARNQLVDIVYKSGGNLDFYTLKQSLEKRGIRLPDGMVRELHKAANDLIQNKAVDLKAEQNNIAHDSLIQFVAASPNATKADIKGFLNKLPPTEQAGWEKLIESHGGNVKAAVDAYNITEAEILKTTGASPRAPTVVGRGSIDASELTEKDAAERMFTTKNGVKLRIASVSVSMVDIHTGKQLTENEKQAAFNGQYGRDDDERDAYRNAYNLAAFVGKANTLGMDSPQLTTALSQIRTLDAETKAILGLRVNLVGQGVDAQKIETHNKAVFDKAIGSSRQPSLRDVMNKGK